MFMRHPFLFSTEQSIASGFAQCLEVLWAGVGGIPSDVIRSCVALIEDCSDVPSRECNVH